MLLRLLSAAGMAVGVVATAAVADALLPRRWRLAVLAAALAAVTPIAVSIGSYGYNDGVAVAVGAALLATTCRVAWGAGRPLVWSAPRCSPRWRCSPVPRCSRSSR